MNDPPQTSTPRSDDKKTTRTGFQRRFVQGLRGWFAGQVQPEPFAYALFALLITLWVGSSLFDSLQWQLFLSRSRSGFEAGLGAWSAPLDDVFIHFDFARGAARGYPFEWSEGNGYSSGGTSLLYPFVLAIGYKLGYTGTDLMLWAGVVACVSIWWALLKSRCLVARLPVWCSWLLPPAMLSVGVLNWTLWSGMEVAFLLAIWASSLVAWMRFEMLEPGASEVRPTLLLGFWSALLVATRPECVVVVACYVLLLLFRPRRHASLGVTLRSTVFVGGPAALVVVGQAIANRMLTGDWSAAGAVVKLELNNPSLTGAEILVAWFQNMKGQLLGLTNHHFSTLHVPAPWLGELLRSWSETWPPFGGGPSDVSVLSAGWAVWALAALPLFDARTRRPAMLLWLLALSFMALVAFNGHVRWQNQRYSMPAVAWLLLSVGLGLGLLLFRLIEWRDSVSPARRVVVNNAALLGLSALFLLGRSEPNRYQTWLFGRAARNIFDQHARVASRLKASEPSPRRLLIGDAGAIPYITDIPALDMIGLGGYRGLPFARAQRLGVAAGLELLERMPAADRPDVMAIYPEWWRDMPSWFGKELWHAGVRGNVVSGGPTKVVYRANWSALEGSALPAKQWDEGLIASLDFADIVSEREAEYVLTNVSRARHVEMKMLPHPQDPSRDLWDAGRVLPQGSTSRFVLRGFRPQLPARLVVRVAPYQSATLRVLEREQEIGQWSLQAGDAWQELDLVVADSQVNEALRLRVEVLQGEAILFHLWGLQAH